MANQNDDKQLPPPPPPSQDVKPVEPTSIAVNTEKPGKYTGTVYIREDKQTKKD